MSVAGLCSIALCRLCIASVLRCQAADGDPIEAVAALREEPQEAVVQQASERHRHAQTLGHIQPPNAQVPSATRDTRSSVPRMSTDSVCTCILVLGLTSDSIAKDPVLDLSPARYVGRGHPVFPPPPSAFTSSRLSVATCE